MKEHKNEKKEDQKEKNDENTPFLDCIWQMEIPLKNDPQKQQVFFFLQKYYKARCAALNNDNSRLRD